MTCFPLVPHRHFRSHQPHSSHQFSSSLNRRARNHQPESSRWPSRTIAILPAWLQVPAKKVLLLPSRRPPPPSDLRATDVIPLECARANLLHQQQATLIDFRQQSRQHSSLSGGSKTGAIPLVREPNGERRKLLQNRLLLHLFQLPRSLPLLRLLHLLRPYLPPRLLPLHPRSLRRFRRRASMIYCPPALPPPVPLLRLPPLLAHLYPRQSMICSHRERLPCRQWTRCSPPVPHQLQ